MTKRWINNQNSFTTKFLLISESTNVCSSSMCIIVNAALTFDYTSFKICTHLRVLSISSALSFFQEYEKALKYIRTLLRNEPGNKQALDLEKLIDKALKKGKNQSESQHNNRIVSVIVKVYEHILLTPTCCCLDGLVGMAIVGGIGLGVAGLAGLIGLAVSKGAAKS